MNILGYSISAKIYDEDDKYKLDKDRFEPVCDRLKEGIRLQNLTKVYITLLDNYIKIVFNNNINNNYYLN